jgi:hypothetical protein
MRGLNRNRAARLLRRQRGRARSSNAAPSNAPITGTACAAGFCVTAKLLGDPPSHNADFSVLDCYAVFLGSEQTVLAALHNDILQEFEELSLSKSG